MTILRRADTIPATEISMTTNPPKNDTPDKALVEREYRKTATIKAVQWWKMGDHPDVVLKSDPLRYADEGIPWIETLEGGHVVTPGDWIATGVNGEHWPIKPDVFAKTYEPVEAAPSQPQHGGLREARWRERWYGSEPEKGSSIVTERGNLIAYFGGDEQTHKIVRKVVAAHNAALASNSPVVGEDAIDWERPLTDREQAMIDAAWEKHKAAAPCTIPPKGWRCTRTRGHDGPCAAVPTPTDTADDEPRCSTCGETNAAFFCSNGFHAGLRILPTDTADRREAVARPDAAIEALTNGQQQADMDGTFVKVSRQALDETLAYIATIAGPLPEGFVAVPVEPTEAMIEAGDGWNTPMSKALVASAYRNMIAARPGADA